MLTSQSVYASDLSKFGINYFQSPSPCKAQEDLLKSCDVALGACKAANDSKAAVIADLKDINREQSEQIQSLTESNQSILRNPILWFALGVLTTSLTIAIVK